MERPFGNTGIYIKIFCTCNLLSINMSKIDIEEKDRESLKAINRYIEENIRSDEESGIDFIDPRDHAYRLKASQNHVVFGRRGAGKSTLFKQIDSNKKRLKIDVDIESYKDISFPNVVLHILKDALEGLRERIIEKCPITEGYLLARKFSYFNLRKKINKIDETILEPDEYDQEVRHTEDREANASVPMGTSTTAGGRVSSSREVTRTVNESKITNLLRQLQKYKELIVESIKYLGNPEVFIMMDDFYFLNKEIQPNTLDFFHRISKDISVYVKVASIKNRTILHKRRDDSSFGMELGHDIQDIDMDYTLDDFDSLKDFMDRLMSRVSERSDGSFYNMREIFAGDGFNTLCLASGGVPRDFLSLLRSCIDRFVLSDGTKIGVKQVRGVAIGRIEDKKSYLQEDAGKEADILDAYLNYIVDYVYREKRRNVFLVAKDELDNYPKSRQSIKELVDLRLIHLLDKNTSKAPSDGRQYEGYMIDVGLYDNTKPRDFTEVQPGAADSESRKTELRSSPVLDLPELERNLQDSVPLDNMTLSPASTDGTQARQGG